MPKGSGSIQVAIGALRARERELSAELASLQQALRTLESSASKTTRTPTASPGKRTHNMSAAGRAAIAKAARKRWAAWRAAKRAKKKG